MRVRNWNPKKFDSMLAESSMDRVRNAAEAIADEIRAKCPVGTISRPMYQTGRYAGKDWTKRDAGTLKKSIRVTEKKEIWGFEVWRQRNVRVYIGHYFAWYAAIVEFYTPFVRRGWRSALPKAKKALGYAKAKGRA